MSSIATIDHSADLRERKTLVGSLISSAAANEKRSGVVGVR
jgi:hypothetical protein